MALSSSSSDAEPILHDAADSVRLTTTSFSSPSVIPSASILALDNEFSQMKLQDSSSLLILFAHLKKFIGLLTEFSTISIQKGRRTMQAFAQKILNNSLVDGNALDHDHDNISLTGDLSKWAEGIGATNPHLWGSSPLLQQSVGTVLSQVHWDEMRMIMEKLDLFFDNLNEIIANMDNVIKKIEHDFPAKRRTDCRHTCQFLREVKTIFQDEVASRWRIYEVLRKSFSPTSGMRKVDRRLIMVLTNQWVMNTEIDEARVHFLVAAAIETMK
eukprot:g4233.t1